LDIPEDVIEQYKKYKIILDANKTIRFEPILADSYQGIGVGNLIFPFVKDIAKSFNKNCIILHGGVLTRNTRAVNYYLKQGFVKVGEYMNSEKNMTVDMMLKITK